MTCGSFRAGIFLLEKYNRSAMPPKLEIQSKLLAFLAKAVRPENNGKQSGSNGKYNAEQ
jgi:hypothetical protein